MTASTSDYTAAMIADSTDYRQVVMTGDERAAVQWALSERRAPTVFMRYRNVKDVTADFGANNLLANADPIANTGSTLDSTNLIAIRNSLTGPTDLIFPANRMVFLRKPVGWNVDDIKFIHKGMRGCGGLWNGFAGTWGPATNFYATRTLFYNTQSPSVLNDSVVYRACWGAGSTAGTDIPKGDNQFTVGAADFAAVSTGDRICICSGRARVYDTDQLIPMFKWTTDVVRKIGTDTIEVSDVTGFPETFYADNIAGNFVAGVSGYMSIVSSTIPLNDTNVFFRYADLAPATQIYNTMADTSLTQDWHVRGVEFYDMMLGSWQGVQQGHMPWNSRFERNVMRSGGTGMVFNCGQNTIIRDNLIEFGSQAHESGVATCFMNITDNDFVWNGDSSYGGDPSRPWLVASGEAENNCVFARNRVWAAGWSASNEDSSLMRSQGYKNTYQSLMFEVQSTSLRIINIDTFGDDQSFGWGNRFEDIYVRNTCSTRPDYPPFRVTGHGNVLTGVEGDYPNVTVFTNSSSSSSTNYSVLTGSYNRITDCAFFGAEGIKGTITSGLKLNAGAEYNTVTRWNAPITDNSGSTTNSFTGSSTGAARPDLWRRQTVLASPSSVNGYANTVARSDHVHGVASTSTSGFLSSSGKALLNTLPYQGIIQLYPLHSALTFSTMANTVSLKPGAGQAFVRIPSLANVNVLEFQAKITTAATTGCCLAPIFSTSSAAAWNFFDGSSAIAGAAPPTSSDVFAIQLNQGTGVWYPITVTIPSTARVAGVYLSYATFGGDGVSSPAVSGITYTLT